MTLENSIGSNFSRIQIRRRRMAWTVCAENRQPDMLNLSNEFPSRDSAL